MKPDFARNLAVFLMIIFSLTASAQNTGTLRGKIIDAHSNDELPGANIIIEGTSIGTTTDIRGEYRLSNVPVGKRIVVFSYLGYESIRIEIDLTPGQTQELDVELKVQAVLGEEVVVTGQLQGQRRAINEQLSSNTIVNIVSSDRIQELPDQNAAETLGHLPGISVQRESGEGQKVVVRGLSPKFNSITINGVRVPATDPIDRSVDLSMVSPDILAGIEVFKALTPDKDGDAIGGTINLVTRRAPDDFKGSVRLQSGYNSHQNEYGQFKGSANISNRFFDKKLGVFLTLTGQNANRSSDVLSASYLFRREAREGETRPVIDIDDLNLADRLEQRNRYGGSIALDYELQSGSIFLNSFYSRSDREEQQRRKRYRVGSARTEYELFDREINTTLFNNSLGGEYGIGPFDIDMLLSFSNSIQETPFFNFSKFQEVGAFRDGVIYNKGPEVIPPFARNDLDRTWFQYGTLTTGLVDDINSTAQLNLRWNYALGTNISGYVKAGGKYRTKDREKDFNEFRTDFGVIDEIGQANSDKYELFEGHIKFSNFLDPTFSAGEFLNGQYVFGPGLNRQMLNEFQEIFRDRYELNRFIELDDYTAGEDIAAGYLMTEINIGRFLMIMPGFRYENTKTSYLGKYGSLGGNLGQSGTLLDTIGGQNYEEFLPMFHIKFKPFDEFDIRLAVTKSIARPDYFNLVPFERISFGEGTIQRGNPDLKHTKAWNYDIFLSFYNRLGLFTTGIFYKTLQDIDYIRESRVVGGSFNGYRLTEPVNADETTVYGAEFEIQTNLTFLPSPFDGVVINANFTILNSETLYPFLLIGPRSTTPPFQPIVIDTFRTGQMPGQADNIANLSLGYEKGGFSGRVSVTYQGESLQIIGLRSELDGYSRSFTRWDIALSYEIIRGLKLFFNANNVTNLPEGSYLGVENFATRNEYFGWTSDLGISFNF
jgi:TonB-dependent receptor